MPATHISSVNSYRREASMKDLNALGKPSKLPNSPDEAELERVANPHPDCHFVARFTQPEFTSLCPVTAQPGCPSCNRLYPRPVDGRVQIIQAISGTVFVTIKRFTRLARSISAKSWSNFWHRAGSELAAIGIPVAVCPLMCFGNMAKCRTMSGFLTRGLPAIAAVASVICYRS